MCPRRGNLVSWAHCVFLGLVLTRVGFSVHTMDGLFGKYKIIREVGRGTTGRVYLAHDPFLGFDVALKIYDMVVTEEDEAATLRRIFLNEASMVGRLKHRNILPVYDAGEEDGRYYIAMESVPCARTLENYCKPEHLMTLDDAVQVVFQCAKALHHAARHGVIHRDVKPSNIMLTLDSEVRLIDFGIAQNARAEHSQISNVAGSPFYMSPEQINGDRITQRSDIYSLGVVLYALLTGRRPFRASTLDGLLHSIVNDEPRTILECRSDVPERLCAIVGKAMQKNPSDRYRNGSELAADLFGAFRRLQSVNETLEFEERVNALCDLSFFQAFSRAEIVEVLRSAVWANYDAGEEIVLEGSSDGRFYVVVSGRAAVQRDGVQFAELGAGDCFGEAALLEDARRLASICATENVTALYLDMPRMVQMSPSSQLRFLKTSLRMIVSRLSAPGDPGTPMTGGLSRSA